MSGTSAAILVMAAATAAIIWQLIRTLRAYHQHRLLKLSSKAEQPELVLWREQLAALEQGYAEGHLDRSQYNESRRELARAAAGLQHQADSAEAAARDARSLRSDPLLWMLPAVILSALALYHAIGSPGYPDQRQVSAGLMGQQAAERAAAAFRAGRESTSGDPAHRALVEKLARTLKASEAAGEPGDPVGYRLLGEHLSALGESQRAWRAYAKAKSLLGERAEPELDIAQGAEMIAAAGGYVSVEARLLLAAAVGRHSGSFSAAPPEVYLAWYYLGEWSAQHGAPAEALRIWRRIHRLAPATLPWRSELAERIQQAENARLPATGAADSDAGLAPGRILEMVDSLAQRLDDDPDDLAGWLRLIRAYRVLGLSEKQAAAIAAARAQFAGNARALADISVEALAE